MDNTFIEKAGHVLEGERKAFEGKLQAVLPPANDEKPVVRDESHADALVKTMVEIEAEIERVTEAAALKVGRLQDRLDGINYVWHSALRDWADKRIEELKSKRKSVVLDNGILGFRTAPAKTVTESEAELIKWAETECIEAVTYHPRVSVTKVSEWETKHGKLAPGRKAVDAEKKFYIKTPKSKEGDE